MQAKKAGLSSSFAEEMSMAAASIFAWTQNVRSCATAQDAAIIDLVHEGLDQAQNARDAAIECSKLIHEAVAAEVFGDDAMEKNQISAAISEYKRALGELQQAQYCLCRVDAQALHRTLLQASKACASERSPAPTINFPFSKQKPLHEELQERTRHVETKLAQLTGKHFGIGPKE